MSEEKLDLFKDVLQSLNLKTGNLYDQDRMSDKDYPSYVVNKAYSFGEDILISNMLNLNSHLPLKMQYDFYYYGLDTKKRYNKWIKKQSINTVEQIKKYCNCSYKRAIEYSKLVSKEQLDEIIKINDRMQDSVG